MINMNGKKILGIAFLIAALLLAMAMVSADDRSYSITHDSIELTVSEDGNLHVRETLSYSFKGEFSGVYRDITLRDGQSISNITVSAEGAYPVLKQEDQNGNKHLIVYLYADEAHTQKVHDCDVKVTLSYDFSNVVTLYNDVGLLQYNLWGKNWKDDVDGIDLKVHVPADAGNNIYFTPIDAIKSNATSGNTITASTDHISEGEVCGFVLLMPVDDFNDNATYAKHIDENGKDKILASIEESQGKENFIAQIFMILAGLPIIIPISGLAVYLKYGREPEVNYDGIYERELPSDDSPAVVNALADNSKVGTPNMKGFEATILDLIDRKVLNLQAKEDPETEIKDLILTFSGSTDGLSKSERIVYNTLYNFADDDTLNLSELNSQLNSEFTARWFAEQIEFWQETVRDEIDGGVEEYFNNDGSSIMKLIGGFGIFLGIVIIALSFIFNVRNIIYPILGGVFSIIISAVFMFLPETIFGQWSEKGRVFYLKWNNLKKFLMDNSLIKEHPPESIVIWRKYLIYGTSLGVAENVYKSMKLHAPEVIDYDDGLFMYHYYGGYYMMSNAYSIGDNFSDASSFDFGGFDDFGGGGFDGGGGGAF